MDSPPRRVSLLVLSSNTVMERDLSRCTSAGALRGLDADAEMTARIAATTGAPTVSVISGCATGCVRSASGGSR